MIAVCARSLSRSIPACTGEPSGSAPASRCVEVYPRVYGGTEISALSRGWTRGLSPRVRGNHYTTNAAAGLTGSIPACTGEPPTSVGLRPSLTVYPRVYGGTLGRSLGRLGSLGLSPRVRGNPEHRPRRSHLSRSIPACTGEPGGKWVWKVWDTVYPRVYGGTARHPRLKLPLCGLSPRVRGNLSNQGSDAVGFRSIPACTGEPKSFSSWLAGNKVYPRVYGGTSPRGPKRASNAGLSPRVRGNHDVESEHRFHVRSIPACTGEPGE